MSIQTEVTDLYCHFCKLQGQEARLIRSMHGLYCSNLSCVSHSPDANLVPPGACEKCTENTFFIETSSFYQCISCGFTELVE